MKRVKVVFIILLTAILVVSGFVLGGTNSSIAKAATVFPEGSKIGGVDVGGKTPDESVTLILQEIEQWKNESKFVVTLTGQKVTIPYESIKFDIKGSVEELEGMVKKKWYEFFKKAKPQQIPLKVQVTLDENVISQLGESVDVEQTVKLIEEVVSYLGEHEIEGIMTAEALLIEEVIAEESWTIPEDFLHLSFFIDEINGLEIPANTQFSFNEQVANEVSHFGQEEGNFVASMIYSLVLQSNLELVERVSQGEIPSYSEAGIEAYVNPKKNIDFVIYNPGPTSYKFSAEQVGTELNMKLLSPPVQTSHSYTIENETDVKYQTIVRYDADLKPGHYQVLQEGQNGKRVEVYKTNRDENGAVVSNDLIARDFYLPQPKIVLKAPVTEEEITDLENGKISENDLSKIQEILGNSENQNGIDGGLQIPEDLELNDEEIAVLLPLILKNMGLTDELINELTEEELAVLLSFILKNHGEPDETKNELIEDELAELIKIIGQQ